MEKQEEEEERKEVKIILLGESGVGKTCIINRYIKNVFISGSTSTVGCSSNKKKILKDDKKYILNVWDTTGQEKYHSLANLFINGADIVILVYEIDSKESFENLNYWYNCVKEKLEEQSYILAVVGSKSDLVDNEEVSEEEGKNYADGLKANFKLVSAKVDDKGINSLFESLLNEYIEKLSTSKIVDSLDISTSQRTKKKKKCC